MNNNPQNKNLKEAILNTIVFFDMFEYPLTAFEIWKYLPVKCDYFDIENKLSENILDSKDGFYFLPNREEVINTRMERYNITDRKFKRAILISRIFKFIPWIHMIAVGNLIGSNNLRDKSDIDLLIITQKNRIWITRFCTVLVTKFLGVRPRINDTKDKICLSFFVSEDGLAMNNLRLEKDLYFTYWLANLTPIFDINGYYDKLIKENNWLNKELPNWENMKVVRNRGVGKSFPRTYQNVIDLIFGGFEKVIKKYQLKILPRDIKEMMNKDTRVMVSDKILKFHVNDRRELFCERYEKLISKTK